MAKASLVRAKSMQEKGDGSGGKFCAKGSPSVPVQILNLDQIEDKYLLYSLLLL